MEKQSTSPRIPLVIHAILLLILTLVAALTVKAEAPDQVLIKGDLRARGGDVSSAFVIVEVNGEICTRFTLRRNGRFEFSLPVGTKARLIFEKPGYLTKEVLVDTRNALNSARARKLNKLVTFDVELESEEKLMQLMYAGPVGSIHFVNGTGLMRVRQERHLVGVEHAEH